MNGIPMEGGRLTLETKQREFGIHGRFQVNVVFTDEAGSVSRWRYRDFINYKPHTRDKSLLGKLRLAHEWWCKKLFGFIEDLFIAVTDNEFNKTITTIKAYGPDMEGMVAYAINTLSWHISLLVTSQWVSTPPLFFTHLIPTLPKRFELTHDGGVDGVDYILKIGKEPPVELTIDSKRSSESALIKYNSIPRIRVKQEKHIPNLDKAYKRALFEGMMRALLNYHLVEINGIEHYRVDHESAHWCWMPLEASYGIDELRMFHEGCLKYRESLKDKVYYNPNGNLTLGKENDATFHINGYDVMVGFGMGLFGGLMYYSVTPVGETKAPTGFDIESIERVLLAMVEEIVEGEYAYENEAFIDAIYDALES